MNATTNNTGNTETARAVVLTIDGERSYGNPADVEGAKMIARLAREQGRAVTLRFETVPARLVPASVADRDAAREAAINDALEARYQRDQKRAAARREADAKIAQHKRDNPRNGCPYCGGWGRPEHAHRHGGQCYHCGAMPSTPTL